MRMNDKTYDFLKKLSLLLINVVTFVILQFGEIWNIPNAVPIAKTITLVGEAIGIALVISSKTYYADDGGDSEDIDFEVEDDDETSDME